VSTTLDSQSGYQAPRAFFSAGALAAGGRLFGTTIGPVVTPRRVVDSLLTGAADAGPLDAWWHDLLRHHEPAVAARLRVIARTPSTPMPFLAASGAMAQDVRTRLITAFDAVATTAELAETRATLQLFGFAQVDSAEYSRLAERAREIDALGYTRLQ
jgi:ABC-type phosphate/phosphonate transport system substrate-binding protein